MKLLLHSLGEEGVFSGELVEALMFLRLPLLGLSLRLIEVLSLRPDFEWRLGLQASFCLCDDVSLVVSGCCGWEGGRALLLSQPIGSDKIINRKNL